MKCSEGCQEAALSEDASGTGKKKKKYIYIEKTGAEQTGTLTGFWTMVRPAINVQRTHETRYLYQYPMKYTSSWLLSRCYYCLQVFDLDFFFVLNWHWDSLTLVETEAKGRRLLQGTGTGLSV